MCNKRVDCKYLKPPRRHVKRYHCEAPNFEGDCLVYLGKAVTCKKMTPHKKQS